MTRFFIIVFGWFALFTECGYCQTFDNTTSSQSGDSGALLNSAEIASIVKNFYGDSPDTTEVMAHYEWVTSERADIPYWVFQQRAQGEYIAISDPCLSSTAGRSQALLRAWFLALVSLDTKVEIVLESFQAIDQQSRAEESSYEYRQFVRYSPTPRDVAFKVNREWVSIFGETFVEVREVDPTRESYDVLFSANSAQPTVGEFMIQGSEDNFRDKKLIRSELSIYGTASGVPQNNYYLSFGTRSDATLMRSLNDIEIHNNEKGRFWYEDSYNANELSEELKPVEAQLSSGIWAPIFEVMAAKILNFAGYPYKVKTVNELSTYKLYSLIRSSFSGSITITFNGFIIKNNKIYPDWTILL